YCTLFLYQLLFINYYHNYTRMSITQKVARNTVLLYARMFVIMIITLYMSRLVLELLGVSDFGIYSVVGGIVAMFGFLNMAMTSATQRYFSFEIGGGSLSKLRNTFSASINIHIVVTILILLLAETL